jgi:sialate O-acetylesterase
MPSSKTTPGSHEAYYDTFYHANSIKDYQILQRNTKNNTTTVEFTNGKQQIYNIGGPYTIENAKNVYVGDIWIMAGQSNMRGHGYQVNPYTNSSLIEHGKPGIHLYNSKEEWIQAEEPLHQLYMSNRRVHHTLPDPTVKNPKLLEYRGASLGLAFAKHYQNELNIPIGLVASAHGGRSLEDWKRPETINKETEDTTLYGAMMARIKEVGRIAGILWYQGESDTNTVGEATTYETRFRQWLDQVRKDVGFYTLPIVFVQIGAHAIDAEEIKRNWEIVQLAQFRVMLDQVYTAGVSSLGCSLDDRVHLSAVGLKIVGKRLATAALKLLNPQDTSVFLSNDTFSATYQNPIIPELKDKIPPCILFTFADKTWPVTDNNSSSDELYRDILGFGLKCTDKRVEIIKARLVDNGIDNKVEIWITQKPNVPLFLTYGLKYPLINSFDTEWPAFSIEVKA